MNRIVASVVALSLLGVSFVMGCGEDASAPKALTLDEYNTQAIGFECQRMFACCDMAEVLERANSLGIPVPKTVEECATAWAAVSEKQIVGYLRDAIAAGRLVFDGAKAARCIASVEPENCAKGEYPDCNGLWTGTVPLGGACVESGECADPDLVCPLTMGASTGTCKPKPKEGEACDITVSCASGLICVETNMISTCVRLFANGEACTADFDCSSNYCDTSGQCAPLRVVGESCVAQDDCIISYCDTTSMKCAALKNSGENCTEAFQCMYGACDPTTQTCTFPPGPSCDGK